MSAALIAGVLAGAGVFLLLCRGSLRVILGFILLSHAVNVLLIATGGLQRRGAALDAVDPGRTADPLPQAFVLTSIVITFGLTIYLLGMLRFGDLSAPPGRPDRQQSAESERDQP